MKQSQRIVKNVFASGLAVGFGGIIQLAAVALLARSVGLAQFGTYSFILAFAMFFQLLADSGLCNILIRELARAPERLAEVLGAAVSLIWLMTFVVFAVMAGAVLFLHFPRSIKLLALLMGAATLSQFHAMGYGSVLRAKEENELHALGFFLHKVLFFVCIVATIQFHLGLTGVALAHLIPSLFQWGLYHWLVERRYAHVHMRLDWTFWKYLLTHSMPVGGATMLRLLSQQIDVFIVTLLQDMSTVGLFSGPYRIAMALRFIPQTMSLPLYPMFSRLAHAPDGRPALQVAYARSVKVFLVMGLPVTVIFTGLSHALIAMFLGPKYQPALSALQWMGMAFLPFFIGDPMPFLLTALDEQRFLLFSTLGSVLLRVALNFLLIPHWGFVAPCFAFFAGEVLLLAAMMMRLSTLGFPVNLAEVGWRPVIAGGVMALVLWPCRSFPVLTAIPAAMGGLVIYAAVIWKLGTFSKGEIETAQEGLRFVKPLIQKWSKQPEHTVA